MFQFYNWEEVNINWENVNMNWEEVGFLIDEVFPTIGGGGPIPPPKLKEDEWWKLKPLQEIPKEKKEKLIKIVCKLKDDDREYIKYKAKKEDITITVDHINIIIDELEKNKISVDVQNIS